MSNIVLADATNRTGQNLDSHMNMGTKFGQCDVASAAFRECLNSFELSCSHGTSSLPSIVVLYHIFNPCNIGLPQASVLTAQTRSQTPR